MMLKFLMPHFSSRFCWISLFGFISTLDKFCYINFHQYFSYFALFHHSLLHGLLLGYLVLSAIDWSHVIVLWWHSSHFTISRSNFSLPLGIRIFYEIVKCGVGILKMWCTIWMMACSLPCQATEGGRVWKCRMLPRVWTLHCYIASSWRCKE